MTHRPYPSYKDSGIEWLGEVPEHWETKRLRMVADVQTGVAKGKDNEGRMAVEVPYLRVANVQDGYLDLTEIAMIEIAEGDLPRYLLRAGDVLMNEGGDFDKLGRGHIWRGEIDPCIHQNHVFAVRPRDILSEWLNSFAGSNFAQFFFKTRSKQSTNLASISSTNLMELPLLVPPLPEQQAIATFLDREISKIDELVAEQERLIELLTEKRQAVISHAVTRGLDPSVPLKDSGVEWLGQIPAHWESTRLRFIGELFGRIGFRGYTTEDLVGEMEGAITLSPSNMVDGKLSTESCTYISWEKYHESPEIQIHPDEVLIVKTGSTFGKVAYVSSVHHPMTLNPQLAVFKELKCSSKYFFYYVSSTYIQTQINLSNTGSTIPTMTQQTVMNFPIPFPPNTEQTAIAAYLDEQTSKFDALMAEARRGIELLKERRTALISAAVTGKIDVREAS